jgi:lipopolysaccharide transport system ATP-binding protein
MAHSRVVISVEDVSKQYRLGQVGTGTLAEDLNRWWHRFRGREDPYLKVGERNDRTQRGGSDYVWALERVSFEVAEGEVTGIIGRNGAGKSTLLKILSRVTAPTRGEVRIRGRIASLLEVGTGFHPELSGRENIFLNGAILGMRRHEIARKLDQIIDFSGCERYIDTPVKRYSSGMYVRLAFAVAAHLEPEILIIDEVLAVGDAQFQKKCLGKMGEVAQTGRTVLFVSHNMSSVSNLCRRAIWLSDGTVREDGDARQIVASYLQAGADVTMDRVWHEQDAAPGNAVARLHSVRIFYEGKNSAANITVSTALDIELACWNFEHGAQLNFSVVLYDSHDVCIFNTLSPPRSYPAGMVNGSFGIPGDLLNNGMYRLRVLVVKDQGIVLIDVDNAATFEVHDSRDVEWYGKWTGAVRPKLRWRTSSTTQGAAGSSAEPGGQPERPHAPALDTVRGKH